MLYGSIYKIPENTNESIVTEWWLSEGQGREQYQGTLGVTDMFTVLIVMVIVGLRVC